jgi:hypothetical protein
MRSLLVPWPIASRFHDERVSTDGGRPEAKPGVRLVTRDLLLRRGFIRQRDRSPSGGSKALSTRKLAATVGTRSGDRQPIAMLPWFEAVTADLARMFAAPAT